MAMFEIVAFEDRTPYANMDVTAEDAVMSYVNMCKKYVNPKYTRKGDVSTDSGSMYFTYSDNSGNDKAMFVMLIGQLTSEMIQLIRKELDRFYDVSF